MKRPIIMMTCYRRYWELEKSIENIHNLISEFPIKPEIVMVWACPELRRLWFFQQLLKEGKINHLVIRESTEFDKQGHPTTHMASLNIRKGLDFIKTHYTSPFYIIGHDCDIIVRRGLFGWIHQQIQDKQGIVFFWQNEVRNEHVWFTNFFVVSEDEKYWPPVSEFGHADVLEAQWGDSLMKIGYDNLITSHNSRSQNFNHLYESERLPQFPWKPQYHNSGVFLYVKGYIPWYLRFWQFIKGCFYG